MSYDRQDGYYRQAKAVGYRARSAFKLLELDRRFRLLTPGGHVLDVGAWPGGWMQVALDRVGPTGRVVGADINAVEPLGVPNAVVLQLDIREEGAWTRLVSELGRPADAILSDLSPKLTGIRVRDEAAATELTMTLVAGLSTSLRIGGKLLAKIFMDADFQHRVRELSCRFTKIHRSRPEATRRGSSELYVIAEGFLGP